MRNVCWLKAGLRLGLGLLLLGGVSACSLEKPVRMTTIRVDTEALARDYDRQKQYEKDGPAIQQGPDGGNSIPGARLPVPSQFSHFSCLGINVTGPAIPNRPMPNGMAFCPWYSPKAFSAFARVIPLPPANGTAEVTLPLPVGGNLNIAVWGIQTGTGVCPSVDGPGAQGGAAGPDKVEVYPLAQQNVFMGPNDLSTSIDVASSVLAGFGTQDQRVMCEAPRPSFYFSFGSGPDAPPMGEFVVGDGGSNLYFFNTDPANQVSSVTLNAVVGNAPDSRSMCSDATSCAPSGGSRPSFNVPTTWIESLTSPGQVLAVDATVTFTRQGESTSETANFSIRLSRSITPAVGGGPQAPTQFSILFVPASGSFPDLMRLAWDGSLSNLSNGFFKVEKRVAFNPSGAPIWSHVVNQTGNTFDYHLSSAEIVPGTVHYFSVRACTGESQNGTQLEVCSTGTESGYTFTAGTGTGGTGLKSIWFEGTGAQSTPNEFKFQIDSTQTNQTDQILQSRIIDAAGVQEANSPHVKILQVEKTEFSQSGQAVVSSICSDAIPGVSGCHPYAPLMSSGSGSQAFNLELLPGGNTGLKVQIPSFSNLPSTLRGVEYQLKIRAYDSTGDNARTDVGTLQFLKIRFEWGSPPLASTKILSFKLQGSATGSNEGNTFGDVEEGGSSSGMNLFPIVRNAGDSSPDLTPYHYRVSRVTRKLFEDASASSPSTTVEATLPNLADQTMAGLQYALGGTFPELLTGTTPNYFIRFRPKIWPDNDSITGSQLPLEMSGPPVGAIPWGSDTRAHYVLHVEAYSDSAITQKVAEMDLTLRFKKAGYP